MTWYLAWHLIWRRAGRSRRRPRHARLLRRRAGSSRRRTQRTRLDIALRRSRSLLRRRRVLLLRLLTGIGLTRILHGRRLCREAAIGHAARRPRRRIVVEDIWELRLRRRYGKNNGRNRGKKRTKERADPNPNCGDSCHKSAALCVRCDLRSLHEPCPASKPG